MDQSWSFLSRTGSVATVERFLGIVLEHHEGRLPAWLVPEQVMVATINPEVRPYAETVLSLLSKASATARRRKERFASESAPANSATWSLGNQPPQSSCPCASHPAEQTRARNG